jgi:hypothetical membrane protein
VGATGGGGAGRRAQRRAGFFAIASAAVGLGGVAAALAAAPWFEWTTDALSDLGHPRNASAPVFGAALLASGLLYLDAVWTLRASLGPGRLATAAVATMGAGGLSLALIGVVNESFGAPHLVVSFTYFTFVPLGMLLLAIHMRAYARAFASLTLADAAAAAAFGITVVTAMTWGAPFPSQAIPELIASALLALWAVLVGRLLIAGDFPRPEQATRRPRPSAPPQAPPPGGGG